MSHSVDAGDTSKIVQKALDSELFVKHNFTKKNDTIYLIKSQYYNSNWPQKSSIFKIMYLDDNEDIKIVNRVRKYDKRTRIGISRFELKSDTVSLVLYDFGLQTGYYFKFVPGREDWELTDERIEID